MEHKNTDEKPTVPPQHEGTKKDIDVSVQAADDNDAKKIFMIARNRLMDVNHWHEYAQPITGKFMLTDPSGKQVSRTAEKGDYFKIDIPAPGNADGKGYDWVQIEAIEERGTPDGPNESIAVRVRPASNPNTPGDETAHFFKDSATSSFVVERKGREVVAAVYGRNEVPNTETSNIIDKVRNAIVGTTAILGFSNVQWKNLVKGLVDTK